MTKHNEDPCGLKTVYTAQGLAGADGDPGTPGADGADAATMINFYASSTSSILFEDTDPNWVGANQWFTPAGFTNLTYTNSSGVSKVFLVNCNYNSGTSTGVTGSAFGRSDVDCGIFLGTDLVNALWEVESKVYYSDTGADNTIYDVNQNTNLFHKMTLAAGATVIIQFKTKATADGYLRRAQVYIQELTQ